MGLGALTYVLLYNPQTLETRPAFNLLTASVPAVVVAAVAHLLLTALLVRRAGQGGYAPAVPTAASGRARGEEV